MSARKYEMMIPIIRYALGLDDRNVSKTDIVFNDIYMISSATWLNEEISIKDDTSLVKRALHIRFRALTMIYAECNV